MSKPVFYSVSKRGTSTDLKNGAPNITISSGVATLSVAQTGNIGVGCRIEYNSTHCWIAPNRIGFDSGSTEIKPGYKYEGATSGATGIVRAVHLTSGSWSGGDAAGYIYFEKTTGTWQDNENINEVAPGSNSNIATTNGTLQGNIGNGNTQFVVLTVTGGTPADQASTPVTAIYHEFESLALWESGFTDSSHLNLGTNPDLTTDSIIAHACCYYDDDDGTDDDSQVVFSGQTVDEDGYMVAFVPVGEDESINKQRHDGAWTTGDSAYRLVGSATYRIRLEVDYTRIEGFLLDHIGSSYYCFTTYTSASNCKISNCIFKQTGTTTVQLFRLYSGGSNHVFNNIFDLTGSSAPKAISIDSNSTDDVLYNNTIYGHNSSDYGIYVSDGANTLAKNNLVQNTGSDAYYGTFNSNSDYNLSGDTSDTGGTNDINSASVTFADVTNADYHLDSTDTAAKDAGTDLSSDSNLPIWRDIDGEERSGTWDIGADEYVASSGETASISESISLSDSQTTLAGYISSLSESMSLSDSPSGLGHYGVSIADSISLSDSSSSLAGYLTSVNENLSLTEVLSCIGAFVASQADTLSFTDTISGIAGYLASLTETTALTDTVTGVTAGGANIEETVSLADSVAVVAKYVSALTDTLSLTDALQGLLRLKASQSETIALSDSMAVIQGFLASVLENFSFADTVTADTTQTATLTDTLSLSDSTSVQAHYIVTVAEGVSLMDAYNTLASYITALSETLGLTDTVIGRISTDMAEGPLSVTVTVLGASATVTLKKASIDVELK